jgi:hypothetical protein
MFRQPLGCALICSLLLMPTAHAGGVSEASRASINASIAIPATLIHGSAQLFKDAGQFSVTGVKTIGAMSTIALRGVANGAEASVQVSSKAIEGSALAVGSVLQTSISATGALLVASGKAVMFIPNEAGKALLHHSRAREQ